MNKLLAVVLALLLVVPLSIAYQQSLMTFTLDSSWAVAEQRHAVQVFSKGSMYLEIGNTVVPLLTPEAFAQQRGGKLESTATYGEVNEAVVTDAQYVFVIAQITKGGETYVMNLNAPKAQLTQAKAEMQKLYKTIGFSSEKKFVDAPYEERLEYAGGIGFFTAHPIPWGFVLFLAVIAGIVWWFVRRHKTKKALKAEKK